MRPIISELALSSVDVTGQWHVVDIDFLSELRVELESQNMKNRGQPKNRVPRVVDASIIPPRGFRPKYFPIGTLSPAIRRISRIPSETTTSWRGNYLTKTKSSTKDQRRELPRWFLMACKIEQLETGMVAGPTQFRN